MAESTPILVTGAHRSGTTWVGRMLTIGDRAHYVHEPFAPMNRRSLLSVPPETRFIHQDPDVPGPWAEDLDRISRLQPNWSAILWRMRSPRDLVWGVREAMSIAAARRRGARAVLKDPFAFLSAEWVHRRVGANVVVLVRHPAAFVSSIVRLGWRLDVRWLLEQDRLMDGDLAPFRREFEADAKLDLVGHAILVWRAFTTVSQRLRRDNPDWVVMRYEDLALNPVDEFAALYDWCGLPFDGHVATSLEEMNAPRHGTEVARRSKGGVVRDSRNAIWTWRDRLSPEVVDRVRRDTADEGADWYADERWWDVT